MKFNKLLVLFSASCLFAMARAGKEAKMVQDEDINALISALEAAESTGLENWSDLNTLAHKSGSKSARGSFAIGKPFLGFSLSTGSLLAAQVEILRLVEAFLKLKGELINHFLVLYNDNWEIIRAVSNLIVSKVPKLHHFILKGVTVLRKVLEFAVRAFSEWSVSLPSVSVEASKNTLAHSEEIYGVPSTADIASFLDQYARK